MSLIRRARHDHGRVEGRAAPDHRDRHCTGLETAYAIAELLSGEPMKLQGPARIMESLSDTCLVGDCREVLKTLIAEDLRVQMCVTSPPYWGLRDYGMAGQIGLERTPDDYVTALVEVFRLVRDLLADQGTLWLNNRGRTTMRGTKRSRSSPTISDRARNHSSPRCGCRAERGPSYSADCPSMDVYVGA